jgi:glycosyltransferase involved in cell wall biosynthesis
MRVDVVLPFHRDDHYLWEAVESVLNSRNLDVRLIMMDDRSERDKPLHIPEKFCLPEVDLEIYETESRGYGNALNQSKKYLESEFIALMNSDDLVSPDRLSIQIEKLRESQADLTICGIQKFDRRGTLPSFTGEIDPDHYDYRTLLLGSYGADASWLLRSSVFLTINFNSYELGSDWCAALSKFSHLRVTGVKDKLYFYRIHPAQVTTMQSNSLSEINPIFDEWIKVNAELNLPSVSKEAFIQIAMPWLNVRTNNSISIEVENWFKKYQNLFKGSRQFKVVRRLIERRRTILEYKRKHFTLYFMPTKFKMMVEVTRLKLRNRNTRFRTFSSGIDSDED